MIKTIFFDLGNVLIFFDHEKMWKNLSKVCECSEQTLKETIDKENLFLDYEVGKITTDAFIKALERYLKKRIDPFLFSAAASQIFKENIETTTLLKELHKKGYELAVISNTCEVHFNYLQNEFPIFDLFKNLILSHKVNLRKPDTEIFKYALSLTTSLPGECLFIDDIKEHTDSAEKLGIHTSHFKSLAKLKEDMQKLNIAL